MRSVSRALELLSKRLQSVERENFFLRIFFAVTTIGIVMLVSLHIYQLVSHPSPDHTLLSGTTVMEQESSMESLAESSEVNSLEYNDQLTKMAWRSYNSNHYPMALSKAQHCLDLFAVQAEKEQAQLTENQIPLPMTGKSESMPNEEAHAILSRVLLNNVAACYYIQGLVLKRMERLDEAQVAFQQVIRLVHARVYDPVIRIFWSPEESARELKHEIDIQLANKKASVAPVSETITSN